MLEEANQVFNALYYSRLFWGILLVMSLLTLLIMVIDSIINGVPLF